MPKKSPMASDIEQLKLNKNTGKRKLDNIKSYRTHTLGNHIRTSGKVGNVLNRLSYASTDSVPYFVSTLSRYTAIVGSRREVISRMAQSQEARFGPLVKALAKNIAVEEEKQIMQFVSSINPDIFSGNADDAIEFLNGAKLTLDNKQMTVNTYVNQTINSLREMYYRFASSPSYQNDLMDQIIESIEVDSKNISIAPISDKGAGIKYRGSEKNTLDNFMSASSEVLAILGAAEFKIDDLLRVSQTLSFMYKSAAQSINQTEGGGIENMSDFVELHNDFRSVINKMEAKMDSDEKITFKGGRNAFGFISEFVSSYALMTVLRDFSSEAKNINKDGESIVAGVKDGVSDFAIEVLSGKNEAAFKTADYLITYKGSSLSADSKQVGQSRIDKSGALLYDAGLTVDFAEAFEKAVNSGSISGSVKRMYESMVLNIAANDGYTLGGQPLEREMLFKELIKEKTTFDKKFFSEGLAEKTGGKHGYPLVVTVNGKLHRFSEVIKSMGGKGNFTADIEDGKALTIRKPLRASKDRAGTIFQEKMEKGDGITKPGFIEELPTTQRLVRTIQNGYFKGKTTRRVRFIITLR